MKKMIFGLLAVLVASTSFAGDPPPFADTAYVRGNFNDWGLANPMTWDGAEYTAEISIDAGFWEFKVASEDWTSIDWGHAGDPLVTLGVATDIGPAIFGNFQLDLAESGIYLFRVFDFDYDLGRGILPTGASLEVTRVVPIPAAGLLLLSAIGGLGLFRRK